jgi:hypothetical protein
MLACRVSKLSLLLAGIGSHWFNLLLGDIVYVRMNVFVRLVGMRISLYIWFGVCLLAIGCSGRWCVHASRSMARFLK